MAFFQPKPYMCCHLSFSLSLLHVHPSICPSVYQASVDSPTVLTPFNQKWFLPHAVCFVLFFRPSINPLAYQCHSTVYGWHAWPEAVSTQCGFVLFFVGLGRCHLLSSSSGSTTLHIHLCVRPSVHLSMVHVFTVSGWCMCFLWCFFLRSNVT